MIDGDYMLRLFLEQDDILHPDDGTDDDFQARFHGYTVNLGIDMGSIEEAVSMYWEENVKRDLLSPSPTMSVDEYGVGTACRWFVLGVLAGRDHAKDPRGGPTDPRAV